MQKCETTNRPVGACTVLENFLL